MKKTKVKFKVTELVDSVKEGGSLKVGGEYFGEHSDNTIYFTDTNQMEWVFYIGQTAELVEEKKSKYADATFNSDAEFKTWLKETTFRKIRLKDRGQDLLLLYVADNGEVIHTNAQSRIWNGKFVELEKLKPNINLCFWNSETKALDVMNFEIESITN